jgi:hypothetical protein
MNRPRCRGGCCRWLLGVPERSGSADGLSEPCPVRGGVRRLVLVCRRGARRVEDSSAAIKVGDVVADRPLPPRPVSLAEVARQGLVRPVLPSSQETRILPSFRVPIRLRAAGVPFAVLAVMAVSVVAPAVASATTLASTGAAHALSGVRARVVAEYGRLALAFEPNRGQFDRRARLSRGGRATPCF